MRGYSHIKVTFRSEAEQIKMKIGTVRCSCCRVSSIYFQNGPQKIRLFVARFLSVEKVEFFHLLSHPNGNVQRNIFSWIEIFHQENKSFKFIKITRKLLTCIRVECFKNSKWLIFSSLFWFVSAILSSYAVRYLFGGCW